MRHQRKHIATPARSTSLKYIAILISDNFYSVTERSNLIDHRLSVRLYCLHGLRDCFSEFLYSSIFFLFFIPTCCLVPCDTHWKGFFWRRTASWQSATTIPVRHSEGPPEPNPNPNPNLTLIVQAYLSWIRFPWQWIGATTVPLYYKSWLLSGVFDHNALLKDTNKLIHRRQ